MRSYNVAVGFGDKAASFFSSIKDTKHPFTTCSVMSPNIKFLLHLASTETRRWPLFSGGEPEAVNAGIAAVWGGSRDTARERERDSCSKTSRQHPSMFPALCADRDKRLLPSRGLIGLFTSYNGEGGRQRVGVFVRVLVCVCVCAWERRRNTERATSQRQDNDFY